MLSIAKHQGKHSDSTLIFQKTTHFAMLLFLYCPPVPFFFSLLSHKMSIFSFISKTMLKVAQLSKAPCSKFCRPLFLFHFQPSSLLTKLDNSQVGLCPACSHLYPLSSPILTLSSPIPRNGY